MTRSERTRNALPSFKGASISIGGFLAGLEQQILHRRPPPAIVVEEESRSQPASANGLRIDGLDDPIEHRDVPDRSGARL